MTYGSSMLAIAFKRPPQRTHCSISIPNTRSRRRAQLMRMAFGAGTEAQGLQTARPLAWLVLSRRHGL